MTKKDYETFANALFKKKGTVTEEIYVFTVDLLKEVFEQDNPLFQADKFERACYEGKHIRKSIKEA